jgi:hypothetical protein
MLPLSRVIASSFWIAPPRPAEVAYFKPLRDRIPGRNTCAV